MRSGSMLIARGLTGHCSVIASASRAFILTGHLFITSPRPVFRATQYPSRPYWRSGTTWETRPGQCLLISICGAARTLASIVCSGAALTLLRVLLLYWLSLMAAVSCLLPTAWTLVLKSLCSFSPLTPMILTLFSITFNLGSAVKQRASPNQMYLIGAVLNRFALW